MTSPENTREAALSKLRQQIKEQRARLDPRVLELAAQAAALSQKPGGGKESMVPYDRVAAAEAVRLFLQSHPDADGFEKELLTLLKQETH
ncbi:MAG: hypothetical protein Q8K65_05350 [Alphaproteobacteria bacterium]|nr:hypothetical protein [Alphaproteobacteria bacterium]